MSAPIILYDNRFLDGTPTATDTATGYDVANICDYRSYKSWKATGTGIKNLSVDCTTDHAADCVGIVGHNLYTIGSSITVYGSANGSDWINLHTPQSPTSNYTYVYPFTTATYRYWRVAISSGSAAPEIGEVYVGARLTFPKSMDIPYMPYTAEVEAETVVGKTGYILGSTLRYTRLRFAPSWSNLTQAWLYGAFETFWLNHARYLRPFFWVPDITTFPTHVYFVTLNDTARFVAPLRTATYGSTLTLDMLGVAEV